MNFDPGINLREPNALKTETAVQNRLHFKIISFADMHEWRATKCVRFSLGVLVCMYIIISVSSLQHGGNYCICALGLFYKKTDLCMHKHTDTNTTFTHTFPSVK